MNLGDLLNELYASGFSYLQTDANGPARATRWINQSYQEICDLEDWSFLESTATGSAPLTIADLDEVESVLDTTNKTKLEETDWESITDLYADLTIAGAPVYWYETVGSVINVFPTSTTVTLSVRYFKQPQDLASMTDVPIVPTSYHDIIVLGAWRRALLDDSAAGDYQAIRSEWGDRLNVMRLALLDEPESQLISAGSQDG